MAATCWPCQTNLWSVAPTCYTESTKGCFARSTISATSEVDYSHIPWRNSRFEDEALTEAVATRSRAQNAFEQHQSRAGRRALGFCVSQRHADFMAEFFNARGLRAVAVHSGDTSAPRAASLERLQAGELDIIFAVDMFNEGVDLPLLDTVMMLRPTESQYGCQQFGRGLRTAPDKPHLNVIDYIGNHRTFLLKPQTLLGLEPRGRRYSPRSRRCGPASSIQPGCEVTYDLEAINILRALIGTRPIDAVKQRYEEFEELNGVRPTAAEMFHEGYNPRALRAAYGSWLGFVRSAGGLNNLQSGMLYGRSGEFLDAIEVTHMTKSYKMLVLLAMLNADAFPGQIRVEELAVGFRTLATRNARLHREAAAALVDDEALRRDLERNPIDAWMGARGTDGHSFFAYRNGVFHTTFDVPPASRAAFQSS